MEVAHCQAKIDKEEKTQKEKIKGEETSKRNRWPMEESLRFVA